MEAMIWKNSSNIALSGNNIMETPDSSISFCPQMCKVYYKTDLFYYRLTFVLQLVEMHTRSGSLSVENLKIIVIGDGGVGKTALLKSFSANEFPVDYVPTVIDTYNAGIDLAGKNVVLTMWDTSGQSEYEYIRKLSYQNANICLLCFDTTNEISFANIKTKWLPEVRSMLNKDAKIILVGTKLDLSKQGNNLRTTVQYAAQSLNIDYCECSSKTQEGLPKAFETALQSFFRKGKKKFERKRGQSCMVM